MTHILAYARHAKSLAIDVRETIEHINDDENDFTVDDHRFIRADDIDEIMCGELEGDEYMLGCFNAWFLADILNTTTEAIEAMQKAEAYEGIGKMVLGNNKLAELQQAYVSADGYGHHFAHYDGNEDEIGKYLVFRVN